MVNNFKDRERSMEKPVVRKMCQLQNALNFARKTPKNVKLEDNLVILAPILKVVNAKSFARRIQKILDVLLKVNRQMLIRIHAKDLTVQNVRSFARKIPIIRIVPVPHQSEVLRPMECLVESATISTNSFGVQI